MISAVVADKAPLVMGSITLFSYMAMYVPTSPDAIFGLIAGRSTLADLCTQNAFVARAPFLVAFELVLSILWLGAPHTLSPSADTLTRSYRSG